MKKIQKIVLKRIAEEIVIKRYFFRYCSRNGVPFGLVDWTWKEYQHRYKELMLQ